MTRVLHIINSADHGGISTMLLNYYRYVDRTEVHFDVALSVERVGYDGRELEKLGAKLYYIPIKSRGYRRHVKVLRGILKEGRYDAIHVHSALTSWVDLRIAGQHGIPVRVAHAHNADKTKQPLRQRIKRRIGIWLMGHYATLRLACSRDAAIFTFGKRSLSAKNLRILPNAIECRRFAFDAADRSAVRAELNIPNEAFVFGTVGRMTSEKNQIKAVELLPAVLARRPEARLLLVGDGPCRPAMEKKAASLGVADRVIFTGGRSDVPRLLCAMDAFILPSFQEGFGIAALEAAASGLPVVLTDVIPRELEFIQGSSFLPLAAPDAAWAEALCASNGPKNRCTGAESVACAGYDIAAVAARLEHMYGHAKADQGDTSEKGERR